MMHFNKIQLKKKWLVFKIGMYICIPILLLILPSTYFNKGQSICISKFLLGVECYACGMTRAVMHLIHFEVKLAYEFNKLIIIVFPLLCWVWITSFLNDLKSLKLIKK